MSYNTRHSGHRPRTTKSLEWHPWLLVQLSSSMAHSHTGFLKPSLPCLDCPQLAFGPLPKGLDCISRPPCSADEEFLRQWGSRALLHPLPTPTTPLRELLYSIFSFLIASEKSESENTEKTAVVTNPGKWTTVWRGRGLQEWCRALGEQRGPPPPHSTCALLWAAEQHTQVAKALPQSQELPRDYFLQLLPFRR